MEYFFYGRQSRTRAECVDDRWALRYGRHQVGAVRIVRAGDNMEIWSQAQGRDSLPDGPVAHEVSNELALHDCSTCGFFPVCTHSKRAGFIAAADAARRLEADERLDAAIEENIHARGHAIVHFIRGRLNRHCIVTGGIGGRPIMRA